MICRNRTLIFDSGMDPASGVQRGDPGGQSGSDSEAAELPLPRELGPEDVVDHTPIQEGLPSTPAPVAVPPSKQALRLGAEPHHWLFLGRDISLDRIFI